jgi:GH25 family lysozyme M1 (1,4-beta-N-acetylmuramidase)
MIDLSNNNGPVDFVRLYQAGQRRVYLKLTEGIAFVDPTFHDLRRRAHAAGLMVGAYHFARPHAHSPGAELGHFLGHLPRPVEQVDLRPCLDVEQSPAGVDVGLWVKRFSAGLADAIGLRPLIYSYPSYLESCHLGRAPGPLWLASYGRNDGREHPFRIPRPWTQVAAHQYSSQGHVAGVHGPVDVSHVFNPDELGVAIR